MTSTESESILLLGGAGFMGRALRARLRKRGFHLHVVTRGNEVRDANRDNIYGGGIENTDLLRRLVQQCAGVVHLASATTPGLSGQAPSLEASLNMGPTLGLIEILQQHPQVRVIYISSGGTVYGNPEHDLAPEIAPIKPLSFYGAGKIAVEVFLRCLEQNAGNPVAVLRPSNLYGPGQPLYRGFGVIRTMLQHLHDGSIMTIWGDGSVVRDFIYIDDMISAVECVLADPKATGTLNVGSGIGNSLNDLIRTIEMVSGSRLQIQYDSSRSIDVQRVVLDITKIKSKYDWAPAMSLSEGVARTWKWLCA